MANSGTQQEILGGAWTEQKLACLQKYLQSYCQIFSKNERARYFRTHYVDAFAGTGSIPKPEVELSPLFPELQKDATDFTTGRRYSGIGSVSRI
jgi:hypothetical protein